MNKSTLLMAMCAMVCAVPGGAAEPAHAVEQPPAAQPVPAKIEIADGPFKPTWESLKQYKCPEWFRDAKLGFWAVWGPQSVPMQGDWYARGMYEQDCAQYDYHVKAYGHPSKFGFKDVIPLWKAEKWDPDALMARYKKAGAKYFCMIAMHHDNFDCWNSAHQKWNAVNMGPKRDIAAEWQAAARKHGLRFGMTEHLAASWWFYSNSKGADRTGPLAGVSYDGATPAYADLYWRGNKEPDGYYYIPKAPDFVRKTWSDRVNDMGAHYRPDLLYSDSPLPYADEYGLNMLAQFYNRNIQQHGGTLEAVYTCKQASGGRWVEDLERGVMGETCPEPWQTDTCVGGWYYNAKLYERHEYKTAATILTMLADIVSKNGNLLLNFPLRPDGSLDDDELKILDELAAWMSVNGEAIFGTRPWKVYGEGPCHAGSGSFNEDGLRYTARDIRFTTTSNALYALILGWPDCNRTLIRSLASAAGTITQVSLLGCTDTLAWTQTAEGLDVVLPSTRPCEQACALKIIGSQLQPVPIAAALACYDVQGRIILEARDAEIHGESPRYEQDGKKNQIGYWDNPKDYVSWTFHVLKTGVYSAAVTYSCSPGSEGSEFVVEAAGQKLARKSRATESWSTYLTDTAGLLSFNATGVCTLAVKPGPAPKWGTIGLQSVILTPSPTPPIARRPVPPRTGSAPLVAIAKPNLTVRPNSIHH